ncbi:rhodanese domain-containing protein CG4456-like isoform X1 [Drosophila kikkawai]|uniref:Rhodanese domain-containing protein CG4456-like isoform X1 n=2 Tax=Drosophila kikkawai TaxID=30033 RepID=A0A6P4JNV8_DROKI|nr:rhodanese domain-containing protein CG4456-like isoform X2 [Drosophila kikkawai]
MLLQRFLMASRAHLAKKPQILTLIFHKGNMKRFFGRQEPTAIELVDYEYVKKLPCEPQKLLVDVREPNELEESGQIPTSINIPLAQVCQELVASKQIFECNYGRKRPELDTEIIFHCRSGKRSLQAAEVAVALGFRNVKNYEGSWLDWAKNEGLSS